MVVDLQRLSSHSKMLQWISVVALLAAVTASPNGDYTIIFTKTIRKATPLDISVLIPTIDEPATLTATLQKSEYNRETYVYDDSDVTTETRTYSDLSTVNREIWSFNIPNSLDNSATYKMKMIGSGGLNFTNTTDLSVSQKTMTIYIQTDKPMYKPGQKVQWRVFQVDPDLHPMFNDLTISLHDQDQTKLWEKKNIKRSPEDMMGVVKGDFQIADQVKLGLWTLKVKTMDGEEHTKSFEVAEFVLPKFEVEMTFDSNYHIMSGETIKGKVCGKYTYGKNLKGHISTRAQMTNSYFSGRGDVMMSGGYNMNGYFTCGIGEECSWTTGSKQCKPRLPCPAIEVQAELKDGCAEVEISMKELYWLHPKTNEIMKREGLSVTSEWGSIDRAVRQIFTMNDIQTEMSSKGIQIEANVTEDGTGKVLSGKSSIKLHKQDLQVKFNSQMQSNFKPGLEYRVIMEVKNYDDGTPSAEQLKVNNRPLLMNLTVKKQVTLWYPSWQAGRDDLTGEYGRLVRDDVYLYQRSKNLAFASWMIPVPSSGVIIKMIDPPMDASIDNLVMEAKVVDRYGLEALKSKYVSRHKTSTNNQLSLSKSLVEGNDKVGSVLEFHINSTTVFNKLYYIIIGKGQVRVQDAVKFSPVTDVYTLQITLTEELARQIAPTGRILILTCIEGEREEEMLAASLDFTVDGMMVNDLNLRFAPNETMPGIDLKLLVDAAPNSFVGLLAMDKSMVLLGGTGNDVTLDDVKNNQDQYDSTSGGGIGYYDGRRRKRSMWCYWCGPFSRGGNDPYDTTKNAGVVVFSNCPLFGTPDNSQIYPYYYHRGPFEYDDYEAMPGAPAGPPMMGMPAPAAPAGPAGPGGPVQESAADDGSMLGAAPPALASVTQIRKEFPETWIWTDVSSGSDGKTELTVKAPDTITTWQLTGFAMNVDQGLGVSDGAQLKVFKPFFVSLNLPKYMIQGEETEFQITVFNYKETDQEVVITLKASDDYIIKRTKDQNTVVQQDEKFNLKIKADDSETIVTYLQALKPSKAMAVEVHAQSPEAADGVIRKIVVKPEGKPQSKTDSVLVMLDGNPGTFNKELRIKDLLPGPDSKDALVEGSEYIYITLQGDLMGSALDNLGSLVRMPYGCGEQNMINFVPNIHVLRYLKAVSKATEQIESDAIRFITAGYVRELTYQHDEGGFSAFGNRDEHASTWLSAFVMKSFAEAMPFISVDIIKIEKTLEYILSTEDEEGYFIEYGHVHHNELKGGAGKGDALTAYVVIALETVVDVIEDEALKVRTQRAITSGLRYLKKHFDNGEYSGEDDSSYTLAIVTKAFVCTENGNIAQETKDSAIEKLESKAFSKDGMKYWAEEETKEEKKNNYRSYWSKPSTDVERTAYAAMAYMCKDGLSNVAEVIPITKWLITQQNPNGGFRSTQDTVLTIGYLADFAAAYSSNNDMNVDVTVKTNIKDHTFTTITSDNTGILQRIQLDKTVDTVSLMATGSTGGIAVAQLVVDYYTKEEPTEPAVTVEVLTDMLNNNSFHLTACGTWNLEEDSSMAVVSLTLPSGFEPDYSEMFSTDNSIETETMLRNKKKGLKRVDLKEDEINLYVDKFISKKELCFGPILAERAIEVLNLQAARVQIYDYYDEAHSSFKMYLPGQLQTSIPGIPISVGNDDIQIPVGESKDKDENNAASTVSTSAFTCLSFAFFYLIASFF